MCELDSIDSHLPLREKPVAETVVWNFRNFSPPKEQNLEIHFLTDREAA